MQRTTLQRRAFMTVGVTALVALVVAVRSPWTIAVLVVIALVVAGLAFWRALDNSVESERRIGGAVDGRRLPGPGEDPGIGPGA